MKVVLAYSGGLDTSVAIKWLQEKYGAEVITMTLNVGQQEDLKAIEEKAKALGVSRHYSIDAVDEFINKYVARAIMANAMYEGKYPLGSALSRPLIAEKLVEVALMEKADAVAHGCTGKGNDQVRIEVTVKALAPHLKIIAPVREWELTRDREIMYAKEKGIPIPIKDKPYSVDQNLWGRSIECGPLDDPYMEPPEDAFEWTVDPIKAPNEPTYVKLTFRKGLPVAINDAEMKLKEIIVYLNRIAGQHGVGRIDHIEDRVVGIKSREVYEAPAALCIIEAHKDLEKMTLTKHELSFKLIVDDLWSRLVYGGLWCDPLREDLDAFIDKTQEKVDGEVRLKLYKGSVTVVGRRSPHSLYQLDLATYEEWSKFDQKLAKGFIELWGLQTYLAKSRGGKT
ncbi:MAG: argininosuccinate synthase [Candidatus Nezhaarchaeota archaeon]|nr:argininosuccinate synthase [Candidatus Nezhaarchaeota archaeon]MCX8141495.1 argininosuccinate synthase [Candidatus Nezhaarchaeota archaeon]MDW8049762.1 argininosuccinate synthase [Nitrososphaerota archaeon]